MTISRVFVRVQTTIWETLQKFVDISVWIWCCQGHSCSSLIVHWLDCNAVLAGLPNSSISRLQRVQNNDVHVLARVRKNDHITLILRQYHWLPVQKRIEYKILTLVFKALHNMAPKYLQDLVTVKQSTYSLRSSSSTVLHVPKTQTAYGDRAFLCVAPSLWNKLPDYYNVLFFITVLFLFYALQ